jgi:mannose-6-phosphate isomerase-like protein (cupin superfamily)
MSTAVAQFGPVVNDISGMGDTHELLGGIGTCRWKQVINGMHLNGPWNCVEYVVIPPGASCGKHTHLHTEEIYYILSGGAEMELNAEAIELTAGDLVTATIGTSHGTINRYDRDMEFLVVEVFPGAGSPPAPVRVRVEDSVELAPLFTGPWRTFARIDVPPGSKVERDPVEDGDEVLFVARGSATIEFGGSTVEGGRGLSVGIPPRAPRAIANPSDNETLEVLSTAVGLG